MSYKVQPLRMSPKLSWDKFSAQQIISPYSASKALDTNAQQMFAREAGGSKHAGIALAAGTPHAVVLAAVAGSVVGLCRQHVHASEH